MRKFLSLFLISVLFFYLDFSLLPNLLFGTWHYAYFTIAWLSALLVFGKIKNISFWIAIVTYFLNILMPFYWLIYLLIWLAMFVVVKFIRFIFLENIDSFLKRNILFGIIFFSSNGMFLLLEVLMGNLSFDKLVGAYTLWNIIGIFIMTGIIYNLDEIFILKQFDEIFKEKKI